MPKSNIATLLCLLFLLVAGCSDDGKRLYPYGWTALDAEFDSITVQLERAYISHAPSAQIDSLTRLLDSAASRHHESQLHQSRRHYWDGRLKMRNSDIDEAFREFEKAISMTDSAEYPYDVARVRWNMEGDIACTPENYRAVQDKIEFFREQEDMPLQADYLMTLGTMLNSLGDPQSGRHYYSLADSVMTLYGDSDNIAKNRINHATALAQAGDEAQAARVLREVLEYPAMKADPFACEITNWDIYLYSGDLDALRKAYTNALTDTVGNAEYLKLYEGMLMKEFARRGQLDSVAVYARRADARDVEWSVYNYGKDFAVGRGYAALALGEPDSAASWFLKGVEVADSVARDDMDERISALDTQRRIAEYRHREEMQRITNRYHILVAVLVVVVIAALIVWLLVRRLHRQRVAALGEKLRREHSMRKVLGLQIAMADNDKLVEELKNTIASASPSEMSAAELRRQLLDALNSHTITNSSRDSFLTTFAEISPGFGARLTARYPDLSETEKRLAILIALGLDNKHIARLINVRQESVKQARWRLRMKMALDKDQNLDEILRSMVDDPTA